MIYSLEIKTEPVVEPITLTEIKTHLRIASGFTGDDDLLDVLIMTARVWAENQCRRSFVRRTYRLRMDHFPRCDLLLPRGPVSAVTAVTAEGATVSTAIYETDLYDMPARLRPVFGQVWPVISTPSLNAVVVEYVAGYAPGDTSPTDYAANVPSLVKAAIKLHVEAQYDRDDKLMELNLKQAAALLVPLEIRDFHLE